MSLRKHPCTVAAALISGALQFVALPALAQSGTTVVEPPPAGPGNEQPAVKPAASDVPSLTDASNPTGKSSGSGMMKELRFPAVDADSNGLISRAEFSTFIDAGNVARRTGESGVNPTELLFHQIDKDRDNFLSEAEVNAYQKEQDGNAANR